MTEKEIDKIKPLVGWVQIGLYLNVTAETARKWHKKRRMPLTWSPGGSPMVYPADFEVWVKAGSRKRR